MSDAPVVYVDLIRTGLAAVPLVGPILSAFTPVRPQRWRWIARNANNRKVLARSSERYTNKNDCVAAITQLFGDNSRVWLRQSGQGDTILREAVL